jgi:hypothetical protein
MTNPAAGQDAHVRAAHRVFNKKVAGMVVKGTLGMLLVFAWFAPREIYSWVARTAISESSPKPQVVKVIAVDYDKLEYTATTEDPSAGRIRFTAPCAYAHKDMCPALGMHKPGETHWLTEHEISVSQPEQR